MPCPFAVPALVTDWLRDAGRGPADRRHPMLFVADLHARFERIHPFRGGNRRVGRLATNLLLVRHRFPPAVIYKRDRTRCLNSLRRADRDDRGPRAELFARAVTDGMYRFLLPSLAGPHRLVPLRSLADSELSGNRLPSRPARPPACRSPDGSVVLDKAVGPGLQGQPLQACVNSTHSTVAKIEQVNFATRRVARSAKKYRLGRGKNRPGPQLPRSGGRDADEPCAR